MKEIIFENVCKSYGKNEIVKNLNLKVAAGERLILLGPSGCGKSTTLRLIAGLEEITSGKLYMDNRVVNQVKSGNRNVSMVFQNYALFPHMNVADNITYGLKVHKLPAAEVEERLKSAMEILELDGLEKRKPRDLSGGQRQRVALARAIVKRADYFLLDEPLSNLDAQLRGHARKELVKIHDMYNQTIVYVTHDQVEAMTVGDRIALMNKGELQMIDTPENVYNRPANVFTAKFIGSPSTNILEAHYAEGCLYVEDQCVALPGFWRKQAMNADSRELYLGIRPEHIKLSAERMENSVEGTIRYIENYGNRYAVDFQVGKTDVICVCSRHNFKKHEKVYFVPDMTRIHLFNRENELNIGYPGEIPQEILM